jgi:hypothetical protein
MIRAETWQGDLAEFLDSYRYQPNLTRKLDALGSASFDQEIINEIVLWKVNRYARASGFSYKWPRCYL